MPKTYNDLYIDVRNALREDGSPFPAAEARMLVARAADKTTEKLVRDFRLYVTDELEDKVRELLRRRLKGEPVAYITGEWEFMGLPMEVSPAVLIPRIDTETLAQTAIDYLTGRKMDARVLDLCSGTGCIGCAIAHALPQSRVVLSDVSPEAMAIARRNTAKNDLQGRVSFMDADVTKLPPLMTGSFDLVVSNPPYIPTMEILTLDASVRDSLFVPQRPVYTKVRDAAPALYGLHASVSNSLVADGCFVEGTVRNSILFRDVRVAKGAVVENSIVMQATAIGENATLDHVVLDKGVIIRAGRTLNGYDSFPIIVRKNQTV